MMADKIKGALEVGTNGSGEVVVNHPDLEPDENGVGHIVFSPEQARNLAEILSAKADDAERENVPPVDRSKRCTLHGMDPRGPEHREIESSTGMQKDYVVLCPDERAKGFVRPVRRAYRHLECNTVTTMGLALAETYARDPGFYSGTFCCYCREHRPLNEFVWEGTTEKVGT
jgi:hypothetical protein